MKICGSVTAFMVDEFQKDYRCEKSENDTLPELWIWIKLSLWEEKEEKNIHCEMMLGAKARMKWGNLCLSHPEHESGKHRRKKWKCEWIHCSSACRIFTMVMYVICTTHP